MIRIKIFLIKSKILYFKEVKVVEDIEGIFSSPKNFSIYYLQTQVFDVPVINEFYFEICLFRNTLYFSNVND